jgi:phage FluMu protein Com
MNTREWLEGASKTLYVCGSCGVTMFGQAIPGATVVARVDRQGLLEFTCPECRDVMLEALVTDVPPQSWRSATNGE